MSSQNIIPIPIQIRCNDKSNITNIFERIDGWLIYLNLVSRLKNHRLAAMILKIKKAQDLFVEIMDFYFTQTNALALFLKIHSNFYSHYINM